MSAILYSEPRSGSVLVALVSMHFFNTCQLEAESWAAARAEEVFLTNRVRYETQRTNLVAAWQFGRACFNWAEFAKNRQRREQIAKQGIAVCRRALELNPDLAAPHHYLAMNLGQLARTKKLGALRLVEEMEREFKRASELEPRFENAAPDRSLGLLYLEAPGWPTSIGSRSKARRHLEKAIELSPDYPENRLSLAEAYLKWGEDAGILRELRALDELWPRTKNTLSTEDRKDDWIDWESRRERLRQAIRTEGQTKK